MNTSTFILVSILLGAAFVVTNWCWLHPVEKAAKWQAVKNWVASLFPK